MEINEKNFGCFQRIGLLTYADMFRTGQPTYGYRIMEITGNQSGSVYPFLANAVMHEVFQKVEQPEGFQQARGGKPTQFYDFTPSGLVLAFAELNKLQIPRLENAFIRRA